MKTYFCKLAKRWGTCSSRLFIVSMLSIGAIAAGFTLYMEYRIHEMSITDVSMISFGLVVFFLFLYKCQFGQCSFGQPETCWGGGEGGIIKITSCVLNCF